MAVRPLRLVVAGVHTYTYTYTYTYRGVADGDADEHVVLAELPAGRCVSDELLVHRHPWHLGADRQPRHTHHHYAAVEVGLVVGARTRVGVHVSLNLRQRASLSMREHMVRTHTHTPHTHTRHPSSKSQWPPRIVRTAGLPPCVAWHGMAWHPRLHDSTTHYQGGGDIAFVEFHVASVQIPMYHHHPPPPHHHHRHTTTTTTTTTTEDGHHNRGGARHTRTHSHALTHTRTHRRW